MPDLNFQLNDILEERGKTLVLSIRKMRETLHTRLIGWCSWQEFRKLRFRALSIIIASKLEISFHNYFIRVLGETSEADSTRDNNCPLIEPLRVPVYQGVNLLLREELVSTTYMLGNSSTCPSCLCPMNKINSVKNRSQQRLLLPVQNRCFCYYQTTVFSKKV